jgi:high-affinity nickel-transport protein
MAQILSMVFLGFFLGMRHATDPDHVVAVTTIVSRERRVDRAAGIGMLWGLGHTGTILLVGGAILLFDVVIPRRVGLTMELSVAVMLVLLGVLSLVHRLDGHRHTGDSTPATKGERWFGSHHQSLRPLAIGVVHGLAGSAAIALLVLATIDNAMWGVVYLTVFGIGTVAGMMLITTAISIPFAYTSRRLAGFNRSLGFASGLSSVGFGMFLIYQIAFVDGLFTSYAHWTPR